MTVRTGGDDEPETIDLDIAPAPEIVVLEGVPYVKIAGLSITMRLLRQGVSLTDLREILTDEEDAD